MKHLFIITAILFFNFSANAQSKLLSYDITTIIGTTSIVGDIKPKTGFVTGIENNLTIGKFFTITQTSTFSNIKGQNWIPTYSHNVENARNHALTGGTYYDQFNDFATPDYRNNVIFQNYKTSVFENSVSTGAIIPLGIMEFYFKAGAGIITYHTKTNALDANGNEYDWYNFTDDNGQLLNWSNRTESIKSLNLIMDNTYESKAELYRNDDNRAFTTIPIFKFSFGYNFDAIPKTKIGIKANYIVTPDDLLDGQQWTGWGTLSSHFDSIFELAIGFSYKIK